MATQFPGDSFKTLEFTFHDSKLSCWRPFYPAHIFFAYVVTITGILCFITRLFTKLHQLHLWLGRLYIISMLWATATSLLLTNTGLPIGVMYSFLWVLSMLSIGWIAILVHQRHRSEGELKEKKSSIVWDRFFSAKTLHGCVMLVSWVNVAGRTFVTPLNTEFECFTYPGFKPVSNSRYAYAGGSEINLLPRDDPRYGRLPWAYREESWASIMLLAPFFGAYLVGFIYLYFTVKPPRIFPRNNAQE